MSEELSRDVKNIWKRLFDHTHFLNGEINLLVNEFELKRQDKEVNELFQIIENLTELKDTQIDKIKVLDANLSQLNNQLSGSLSTAKELIDLEIKYKEDTTLEEEKNKRKIIWDKFMEDITEQYSQINCSFEEKEKVLNDRSFHY
ncbi:hypothetical protein WA026_008760 [Henosepilachna vigintioctopunctata]|uniref:Biogenesis of lysosome-related organelles complex 1 subunit 5 n=1 Tax=Henosepilachna vigintioctopunctata TaxID=420089 RepID=A0AAW1V8P0_9CUCU